jgi:hypothetical protein
MTSTGPPGEDGLARNRPLLAVLALVVVTIVIGAGWLLGRPAKGPHPGSSASLDPGASTTDRPAGVPLVATTQVDGSFDVALTHQPTAGPSQSKLWFAEGAWWATIVDPTTQELHIGRLDPVTRRWSDTATLVDERLHVRADALWDGSHLTIVTAGDKPTANQALRISQFHYDAAAGRFAIDSDLPIALTAAGVGDPVLARDSTGILWLAYLDQARLVLRHTLGDVLHWTPAAAAPIAGADGDVRAAALTADGTVLTLVWNRVADETLQVGQHADGADPATWTTDSTPVAGLRDAPGGLSARTVATDGGSRLFVAFETAPDRSPNANSLAPGAIVMVHDSAGTWTNVQLGRVKDHLVSPILVVDDGRDLLVAVASVASSGTIVYKQSPLDRVSFESGRGTDLIVSSTDPSLQNPTSTKQAVDLAAGVVVLGADDGTGHYVHGLLATASPIASGGPSPSVPAGSPSPPPPAEARTVLLHDTFDPWAVGTRTPPDWEASPQSGGAGRVEVVGVPTAVHHSLLVRTTSLDGSIRACTSFAPTATTELTVNELVSFDGVSTSDTTIGSIRGPGGEAASVRVTRHRLLAYYDGTRKVTTTIVVRPGVWYRSTIVIRPATHTYDWTVTNTAGRAVARISGIHWREATIPTLDTLCVQAPQDRGGSILLDDTEVLR